MFDFPKYYNNCRRTLYVYFRYVILVIYFLSYFVSECYGIEMITVYFIGSFYSIYEYSMRHHELRVVTN